MLKYENSEVLNKLISFDKKYSNMNVSTIGVDEAGRGPLAGPVVSGAVLFDENIRYEEFLMLDDSKKLTEKKREILYNTIIKRCYYGIGIANEEEIDNNNILNATFLSMRRALVELGEKIGKNRVKCGIILVDGSHVIRGYEGNQESIVKGDSKSFSIAAASILAKVTRDNIMKKIHKEYPEYDFEQNKGYGTKKHVENIQLHGICKYHRKSFLKNILNENKILHDQLKLF